MDYLQIKKKYMSKKDWHRMKETKYSFHNIEGYIENLLNGKCKAVAGLIEFKDINSEFKVNYFNKETVLLAKGYYWFQIAFENENFWITAILNQELRLLQIYIDITKKMFLNQMVNLFSMTCF